MLEVEINILLLLGAGGDVRDVGYTRRARWFTNMTTWGWGVRRRVDTFMIAWTFLLRKVGKGGRFWGIPQDR